MCKVALCILFGCVVFSDSCICSENGKTSIIFTVNSKNGGNIEHCVVYPHNTNDIRNFFVLCDIAQKISINNKDVDEFHAIQAAIGNVRLEMKGDRCNKGDAKMLKRVIECMEWIGTQEMCSKNPQAAGFCLHELLEKCKDNYGIARELLRSQCDGAYMPCDNADWRIIGDAVHLLKKCGHSGSKKAKELLQRLKETNKYLAIL